MPDTNRTIRAIAKQMLDEELAMILDQLTADQPLTILQRAVTEEATRRASHTKEPAGRV